MTKLLSTLLILLSCYTAQAKVNVLFHPYDNTFEAIVERLKSARETIDLALYNIDLSSKNPVIKYMSSPSFQKRVDQGDVQVRMIFEGFSSKEENLKKMLELEKLGIDVKALGSSKKMHHKFAVIDGRRFDASVITGSANWSMSSRTHYNENILYFDNEGKIAQAFQTEFNFLWGISKEIGKGQTYEESEFEKVNSDLGKVTFNRHNFKVNKKGRLGKIRGKVGFTLTKEVVASIDNAKNIIEVATTRFKLRPIYNAIVRAAKRGVQVKIVVTMGEYEWERQRKKMALPECKDQYHRKCSSGVNYAALLAGSNYEGHENVDVRLKFFNIKTSAYLNKQMHSKYLILDNDLVLSGSFNWSYSGEFNHIENVVELTSEQSPSVLKGFNHDFDRLWELNRGSLAKLHKKITEVKERDEKMKCGFEPMSLSFGEIDGLLKRGRKFCL